MVKPNIMTEDNYTNYVLCQNSTMMKNLNIFIQGFSGGYIVSNPSLNPYKLGDLQNIFETAVNTGIGGVKFNKTRANVAAFLGNCIIETIAYGACDENNWTQQQAMLMANNICSGRSEADCTSAGICSYNDNGTCTQSIYPVKMSETNKLQVYNYPNISSCGQLGQVYAKYTCKDPSEGGCTDDDINEMNNRNVIATTESLWHGAPGPLYASNRDNQKVLTWNSN